VGVGPITQFFMRYLVLRLDVERPAPC